MFELIYNLLKAQDYYGISKEIDIAKGINRAPSSISEAWKQGIRTLKSLKYEKNGN